MSRRKREPPGTPAGGRFAPRAADKTDVELTETNDFPPELEQLLPRSTTRAWRTLAQILPDDAYLAGGTGLTIHLGHRVSRDLDFMLERHTAIEVLRTRIESVGKVVVTQQDAQTLNCVVDDTRVQVLEATNQQMLAPTTMVAGIRVASPEDIMAMKLKVVVDRGELRDYFDLMEMDRLHVVAVEEGLALFLRRYSPSDPDTYISLIVRALGSFGDVADDPALPVPRREIEDYWAARHHRLVARISRW